MANIRTARAERFDVRVTADSHFGWLRTRLSLERIALQSPVVALAILLVCIGVFAFLGVLLRL